MRRIVFTTAASIVAIALAPAGAMARSHHKRHHSRTHHARVRIRHERFGNLTMPTTPTTTPTTPPPPPADSVATVTSFTGGVLTITLNNGSTVSAWSPTRPRSSARRRRRWGRTWPAAAATLALAATIMVRYAEGWIKADADNDDQAEANQTCTTADLTPGAFIRGAELGISSVGATWDKVVLIL